MSDRPLLFAIDSYAAMADELCALGGFERGPIERRRFPDGELYQRIVATAAGRDVLLLGGTCSDADTLELYDLACGLVTQGARRLSLVVPFFGYSTMERAVHPGEVVTAKARARLLSSVPAAAMGNRIFLVDLHVEGLTHYFEGGIHPVHVSARPLIRRIAARLGGDDFVIACTDAGRAKWVEAIANDLGVDAAFVFKRRLDGERTEVAGVSAQVQGKRVVLYDDMIRTGGSLLGAAAAYRAAGATGVAALATHGVLPGDALGRLTGAGLLDALVVTDTHPRARALAGDELAVESVAPLLVEALGAEA